MASRKQRKRATLPSGFLSSSSTHAANQQRTLGRAIVCPFQQSQYLRYRVAQLLEAPENPRSEMAEDISKEVGERLSKAEELRKIRTESELNKMRDELVKNQESGGAMVQVSKAQLANAEKLRAEFVESNAKIVTARMIAANEARELAEDGLFPSLIIRNLNGASAEGMRGSARARAHEQLAEARGLKELTKAQKAEHSPWIEHSVRLACVRWCAVGYLVPDTVAGFDLPAGVVEGYEGGDWTGELDHEQTSKLVEVYLGVGESESLQTAIAVLLAESMVFSSSSAELAKVKKLSAWSLSTAQLLRICDQVATQ